MPLEPDDTICFCFDVSLRKIENFCRHQKPQAASQVSECLSAGTGCAWCIPMIRRIHARVCGQYTPWWRVESDDGYRSAQRDADATEIAADDYATGREEYLKRTGRDRPGD